MKILVVIVALISFGCQKPASISDLDRATLDRVAVQWRLAGLSRLGDCFGRVEVVRHTDLDTYAKKCAGLRAQYVVEQARTSRGCTYTESRGISGRRWFMLGLAPGWGDREGLVIHESLHAALMCAMEHDPFDPADAYHTDKRVWEAAWPAKDPARFLTVERRSMNVSH